MARVLQLYNTFTKQLNRVELNGQLVTSIGGHYHDGYDISRRNNMLTGSFYICGPTVYSDSHLGHALTYIRADLFRRFLRSYFNVHLTTVMNITDIDDKILDKCRDEIEDQKLYSSEPDHHPYRKISDRYYKSFIEDLASIRVQPVDVYAKISDNISVIINYIQKLEQNGQAYLGPDGDVLFNVSSVKNYQGRLDKRKDHSGSLSKRDPRDFVLWKRAKPFEPIWNYKSISSDRIIGGRPGWHVQCSAISNAFFGSQLDFHYGGKDLIFPHHYNEEACCCAYHSLDTKSSMHVWCKNWLHSSHLTIKLDETNNVQDKMSKSLGNVVPIRNFIEKSSVNALRLLCIISHYRSDLEYSQDLIDGVRSLDHRLNALHNFLEDRINRSNIISANDDCINNDGAILMENNTDLESMVLKTGDDIVDGLCEDLDLRKGLDSILTLARYLYSVDDIQLRSKDLIACRSLLRDWCNSCGLKYGLDCENNEHSHGHSMGTANAQGSLQDLIRKFRQQIRSLALTEIKSSSTQQSKQQQQPQQNAAVILSQKLLVECDKVRSDLDNMGFVERDPSYSGKDK